MNKQKRCRCLGIAFAYLYAGQRFEVVGRFCPIDFIWMQDDISEVGLIDGVGQGLRLHSDAGILDDGFSVDCVRVDGAVMHKNDDAVLIGVHFYAYAGFRIGQDRIRLLIEVFQHKRMIKAVCFLCLGVIHFRCNRQFSARPEIKWGAFNRKQGSSWDIRFTQLGETGAVQLQFMLQDRFCGISAQVEIDMVCRVEQCGLIGGGAIGDFPLIIRRQGIRDGDRKISRIAIGAIRIGLRETDARLVGRGLYGSIPDECIKTCRASVQLVCPFILNEVVVFAVQCEFSIGDASGDTADGCAVVRSVCDVIIQGIRRQDDVLTVAVFIGDGNVGNGGAIGHGCEGYTVFIRQRVGNDILAVDLPNYFLRGFHIILSLPLLSQLGAIIAKPATAASRHH